MTDTKKRTINSNSGCLLNIGNGPQSGPALYSKAKGREVAHQFIMVCNAAKGRKEAHYCVEAPKSGI